MSEKNNYILVTLFCLGGILFSLFVLWNSWVFCSCLFFFVIGARNTVNEARKEKLQTQITTKTTVDFDGTVIALLLVGLLGGGLVLYGIIEYRTTFPGPFADNQAIWGAFGDYFNGILTPLISILGFLAVLYSINRTSKKEEKDRDSYQKELKDERDRYEAEQTKYSDEKRLLYLTEVAQKLEEKLKLRLRNLLPESFINKETFYNATHGVQFNHNDRVNFYDCLECSNLFNIFGICLVSILALDPKNPWAIIFCNDYAPYLHQLGSNGWVEGKVRDLFLEKEIRYHFLAEKYKTLT